MIQAAKGDLEITNAFTGKKNTIPLGIKDINVNTHELTLHFNRTPENLTILTINYTNRKTGEYDLYTLVFKNQGMIRKSVAHGLTESHEFLTSDGTLSLIDDNNIRVHFYIIFHKVNHLVVFAVHRKRLPISTIDSPSEGIHFPFT